MQKTELADEIYNFIEYFTSDDAERIEMNKVMDNYLNEVYEEPREVMVFTFDIRKGQEIYWKRAIKDTSPTSEYFPADELHKWVQKYKGYGWKVQVN